MRERLQRFDGLIQALLDIFALVLAGYVSEQIAGEVSFVDYLHSDSENIFLVFIFIPIVFVFDLYYPLRDFRHYRAVMRLIIAVSLFGAILYLIGKTTSDLGHPVFHDAAQLASLIGFLLLFSYASRIGLSLLRRQVFPRKAVVIGASAASRLLLQCIADERHNSTRLGFEIVGYVDDGNPGTRLRDLAYLGPTSELPKLRQQSGISLLIYALDTRDNLQLDELLVSERLRGVHLISAIGLYQAISGRVPHQMVDASWLIEECLRSNRFAQVHMKNLVDITVSAVLAVLSLPFLVLAAVLIKAGSPGPILFKQQRIGRFGKPFVMYKLRTMTEEYDPLPVVTEHWHDRQEARITRVGRLLRRTHIDEIPQLFNVLKGDMSLVGPRPEMEIFINTCEAELPFYRLRLDVKPGITGWAQVAFRHTSSLEAYKQKFEYELYYLSHLSLQLDLEILVRTVFIVLLKRSR